jgi:Outer membrane protein beta-barrel domain
MSSRTLSLIGIFVIATLVGAAAPAQAQGYFGVYGGLYQPEEEDDSDLDRTESFGVRAGYRFQSNFGFEGSLSRVDLADSIPNEDDPFFFDFDLQLDLYNLDLSLQWFPKGGNFVVFGGPGVSRLDAEVSATIFGERFSESDTEDILTAHLGLGYDWQVNDRFFIRPEARVRRYFDDESDEGDVEDDGLGISYEATDYEAGVTFGWRF